MQCDRIGNLLKKNSVNKNWDFIRKLSEDIEATLGNEPETVSNQIKTLIYDKLLY